MNLYKLETVGLGDFFIVATDPTQAEKMLSDNLSSADYGFSSDRKITAIHYIAQTPPKGSILTISKDYRLIL